MKKQIILLLFTCLMFTMTGCGKTEQAQKVDDMIAAIGPITEESGYAIEEAEFEYEKLKGSEKRSLENRDTLTEARTAYDTLQSDKVIVLINNIGEVSTESGETIKTAREGFDALTDNQKKLVHNANVLTEAETKYESIAIEHTKSLINAIGTVTLSSGPAITAAEEAYNALTTEQKEKITNYDTLKTAKESFGNLPPIKINSCSKTKASSYSDRYKVNISITNLSDEIIKKCSFAFFCYDSDNVPVQVDYGDYYSFAFYEDMLKAGNSAVATGYFDGKNVKKIVVVIDEIEFVNDSIWENPQYDELFAKYNEKVLESNDDPNILIK